MERHLGKKFQDEKLKRIINETSNIEELKKVAIELLNYKITYEETMYKMMFHWNRLTPENIDQVMDSTMNSTADPFETI